MQTICKPTTPSYGHGLTNVLFYLPLSGTRGNQNGLVINYELAITVTYQLKIYMTFDSKY